MLAFSTISQLGYMFVGLGVGGAEYGVGPGMFHLFTHAFFKALLFLGAGSVIDALHHATHKEMQDMRLMGGLALAHADYRGYLVDRYAGNLWLPFPLWLL